VPCERTFSRLLEEFPSDELRQMHLAWMAELDPQPVQVLHLDGKVLINADPLRRAWPPFRPWPKPRPLSIPRWNCKNPKPRKLSRWSTFNPRDND
jgi:hypothetical protein